MLKTASSVSGGGGSGTVTSVNATSSNGFSFTGVPITSNGTITLVVPTPGTTGNVLVSNGTAWISQASAAGSNGTVTLINTDSNLTGGPISTTGNIGLANVISFGAGNVTTTNANVGYAIVNINTLNAAVNGLNAQIPVQYASTANLSVTYSNGTLGVGATLTATANGALSIDGGSPTTTQRLLIKDQTANLQNGIYTVTVTGNASAAFVLTRATDYDQSAEMNAGDGFYVELGTANKNTTWVQQTPAPITVGTTAITFLQFGAPGTSTGLPKQPYVANTALYANSTTTLTLGVLPITAGGTGANTASQALANLGGVSTGKAIAMAIVFGG
jgi:hypothetical protein